MKIYLDLLMLLNFSFDAILLLSVAIVLKRIIKFERIVLAAFIGGLSIISLFLPFNNLTLFLFKIVISIIMVLICFGYRDLKHTFNNIIFLYINSIILGGFLYFLNITFSYKNNGLVFYFKGFSINAIILIILSPIIIYIYLNQIKKLKNNYNNYHKVDIYINGKRYSYIGYMDSANNLTYKKFPVILLDMKKVLFKIETFHLLPYQALNYAGLLKVIKLDYVLIDNKKIAKCYLGIMENSLVIDGVDVLLNNKMER